MRNTLPLFIFIILSMLAPDSHATCLTRAPNPLGENITDWGATAGDTTDDREAIQCALDMARSNSKKVIIPGGVFKVNQTITLNTEQYSNVQIVGMGWGSIITHTGGNYAFTVGDGSSLEPESVVFRDFSIEATNATAYGGILYNGLTDGSHNGAHRALVDHMKISNYSSGTAGENGEGGAAIKYRNTWIHTIRNSLIYNSHNGVYANSLAGSGEVNALNIESSDFEAVKYGVVLGQSASVNIRNNTIEGPAVITGVYCFAACKSINVTGNYFEFSGTNTSQMVFIGNSAWNSGINIRENFASLNSASSYVEIRNARGIDVSGNSFIKSPVGTGAAFIKLGAANTTKYIGVNNNYAGSSDTTESWSGIKYISFVVSDTGAPSTAYTGLGTFFDNLSQAFFYGTQTALKRIDQ